ncbi:hypothetical protein ACWEWG_34040 [Streptomyces sp. NPDC003758]
MVAEAVGVGVPVGLGEPEAVEVPDSVAAVAPTRVVATGAAAADRASTLRSGSNATTKVARTPAAVSPKAVPSMILRLCLRCRAACLAVFITRPFGTSS